MSALRETLKAKNGPKWEEERRNLVVPRVAEPQPLNGIDVVVEAKPVRADEGDGFKRSDLTNVEWIRPQVRLSRVFTLTGEYGRASLSLSLEIGEGAIVEVGLLGEDTLVIQRVPEKSKQSARLLADGNIGGLWLAESLRRRGWKAGRYPVSREFDDVWVAKRTSRVDILTRQRKERQ